MPIEPTDRAEPMQGLAEWLRDRAAEREADAMHKVFPHHANILRRWADEVEASRQRPAAKFGCHCDLENTVSGQPDECVFDNGDIEDCVYATELQRQKKGKADCKYWQPIKFATPERPAAHIHGNDAFSIESVAKAVDASMHNERPAAQAASAEQTAAQLAAGALFPQVSGFATPATPAQAPWKAISDAIRKVTGHPDLTSGSLSLLGEIIRALAQASPASDAWRCACSAALYIDAEGKPRSKADDGVVVDHALNTTPVVDQKPTNVRDNADGVQPSQAQRTPEIVAWMWQHEETGRTGFVDVWQVENGWQIANPRLKLVRALTYVTDGVPACPGQTFPLADADAAAKKGTP